MKLIETRIDEIVEKHSLLNHPFYQAWEMGTLSGSALRTYAWQYSNFIGKISEGWRACGNEEIAKEEEEHLDLWLDFAKSLGEKTEGPVIEEVSALVEGCDRSNSSLATALGALYAFERQQPQTSKSKLAGLRSNYAALNADEVYFEVHENDDEEPAMLLAMIEKLSPADQEAALGSCEEVCELLWDALSGIQRATA